MCMLLFCVLLLLLFKENILWNDIHTIDLFFFFTLRFVCVLNGLLLMVLLDFFFFFFTTFLWCLYAKQLWVSVKNRIEKILNNILILFGYYRSKYLLLKVSFFCCFHDCYLLSFVGTLTAREKKSSVCWKSIEFTNRLEYYYYWHFINDLFRLSKWWNTIQKL